MTGLPAEQLRYERGAFPFNGMINRASTLRQCPEPLWDQVKIVALAADTMLVGEAFCARTARAAASCFRR